MIQKQFVPIFQKYRMLVLLALFSRSLFFPPSTSLLEFRTDEKCGFRVLELNLSWISSFQNDTLKFQVSLEECPGEIFADVSIEKCWEMVLQRLNGEILRRNSLGERDLPPLEPLQSINGLEMFGFLSPPIVQVKQPPHAIFN
jgi:hypothetical protein